ncbi:MAG: hypothetical protein QOI25_1003 [Mycobacterium sp.]|jgi:hypothetical protein|nr:hypothetical protein [Mycobacterium sp.]
MAKRDRQPMTAPAGWHEDPNDPALQRFWDGSAWTDRREPTPSNYQRQMLIVAKANLAAAQRSANNTESIRQMLVAYFVVSLLAAIAIYASYNH